MKHAETTEYEFYLQLKEKLEYIDTDTSSSDDSIEDDN